MEPDQGCYAHLHGFQELNFGVPEVGSLHFDLLHKIRTVEGGIFEKIPPAPTRIRTLDLYRHSSYFIQKSQGA